MEQLCMALIVLSSFPSLAKSAYASSPKAYTPHYEPSELVKLMPSSALPSPIGLELKYILLGIGTQNYTCASTDEDDLPGTIGAMARLYDISTCLTNNYLADWIIDFISPLTLESGPRFKQVGQMLRCHGFQQPVGHHFFRQDTPTFALDGLASEAYPIAVVHKVDETDAPSCPCTWPGTPLKWLLLKDKNNMSRGGVDTVYRIETAGGGRPANCKDQRGDFEVDYAAQYWIFGPKGKTDSVYGQSLIRKP